MTPQTTHFKIYEFYCKDGSKVPTKYYKNVQRLMNALEKIREKLGNNPITINSGYRTSIHNKRVNGKPNSQHLTASGADIVVKGKTPTQVRKAILQLMDKGIIPEGGVGIYPTFVHYDIRGKRVEF